MRDDTRYDEIECHGHTPICHKMITRHDWHRPELWNKYGQYFSLYLQKRIHQQRSGFDT